MKYSELEKKTQKRMVAMIQENNHQTDTHFGTAPSQDLISK